MISDEGVISMMNAVWLIPALMVGAAVGLFFCALCLAGKEKHDD